MLCLLLIMSEVKLHSKDMKISIWRYHGENKRSTFLYGGERSIAMTLNISAISSMKMDLYLLKTLLIWLLVLAIRMECSLSILENIVAGQRKEVLMKKNGYKKRYLISSGSFPIQIRTYLRLIKTILSPQQTKVLMGNIKSKKTR